MKKTLIALAAIAATNLAMAQVTVTGELGYGYNKIQPAPGIGGTPSQAAPALMMTDGEINFKAVEDLGGGFKVTIESAVQLKGRDSAVVAKDATIAFLTPIGQITAGTIDADADYPRAFAGSKIFLPSDKQVAGGDKVDLIAFTTKLGPVYTTISYSEGGTQDILDLANALGGPVPAAAFGLPATAPFPSTITLLNGGTAKNLTPGGPGAGKGAVQITSLNGTYAESGPFSAGLTITSYAVGSTVQDIAGLALFRSAYDGRTDVSVSAAYDFGVAKVGLGYADKDKGWGDEVTAGISIPMGALSFGVTYEQKADDTKSLGNGVTAGQFASGSIAALMGGNPTLYLGGKSNLGDFVPGLIAADLKGAAKRTKIRYGVDYAFSKLTSFNVSYGTYELAGAERTMTALGQAQPNNVTTDEFQIRLLKKF